VLLALAFSWAVVQFPMVGAAGFATLVACRVLLGAGEGPAFSVAVHALYKWFPDQQRTIPTAVLTQGAAVGVIVALPLALGILCPGRSRLALGLGLGVAWRAHH
jgi:MFS transporter, ACS family, D-galactonate transporter